MPRTKVPLRSSLFLDMEFNTHADSTAMGLRGKGILMSDYKVAFQSGTEEWVL